MTQPILPLFTDESPKSSESVRPVSRSRAETLNDYEGFVEKFKPKKTTDDCYTPPLIYEAVRAWVDEYLLSLEGVEIVRPFYPGGDYQNTVYPEGCLVLDNPPFSIQAQIRKYYQARGVRYFLFAPALTLNSALCNDTCVVCGAVVTYDNGAKVPTSFATNLCPETAVWVAGTLAQRLEEADKQSQKAQKPPSRPVYSYPVEVTSPALLQKLAKRGIEWKVSRDACHRITRLDCQQGRTIFGGGWLLSERVAAERAAAERVAAQDKVYFELSEREKEIIAGLK